MTREEIIALAKQCGLWSEYAGPIDRIEAFFHAAQKLGASQAQQPTIAEPELPDAVARHNGGGFEWIADWLPTSDLNYYTATQMHDHFAAGVRVGTATVKESLTTGKQRLQVPTGWAAPKDQYAVPVLFNPYTGEPRDVRDVQSDPQGILIVPPGKVHQLAAMQGDKQ